MEFVTALLEYVQAAPGAFALELAGAISGLLCVWLLVRESLWTWPLGLLYAVISLFVFYGERLVSDWILHLYFAVMNGYGWYYWTSGNAKLRPTGQVAIVNVSTRVGMVLAGTTAVAIVLWGMTIERLVPDASLIYWDSTTTVMSFTAMWMTARKQIESWVVWFVIDVLAVGIYLYKGIFPYAALYAVYLVMAVMGWRSWSTSMRSQPQPAAA